LYLGPERLQTDRINDAETLQPAHPTAPRRRQLFNAADQGWSLSNAQLSIAVAFAELVSGMAAVAPLCGLHHIAEVLLQDAAARFSNEPIQIQVSDPHWKERHGREVGHRHCVAPTTAATGFPLLTFRQSQAARSKTLAGCEPLQVSLKWTGIDPIEVDAVKQQVACRRALEPKVHQVGITAQLHHQPGVGLPAQTRSHHRRRASEEGQGALSHAAVTHRHDPGYALRFLVDQQPDLIRALALHAPGTGARHHLMPT
jgi:hypothetical protein